MSKSLIKELIKNLTEVQLIEYHSGKNIYSFYKYDIVNPYDSIFGDYTSYYCICGVSIQHVYVVYNIDTQNKYPIGSECIKNFGEDGIAFIKKQEKKIRKIVKIEKKLDEEKKVHGTYKSTLKYYFNAIKKNYITQNIKITFGKHKGLKIKNVDKNYLLWIINQPDSKNIDFNKIKIKLIELFKDKYKLIV